MKRSFNPLMLALLVGIIYTIWIRLTTYDLRDYKVDTLRVSDSVGRDERAARAVYEGGR